MASGASNPDKSGSAQQLSTQDGETTRNDAIPELLPNELSEHVIGETFVVHGMTVEDFLKKHGMTGVVPKPSGGTGGEEDPLGPKSTSVTEKK